MHLATLYRKTFNTYLEGRAGLEGRANRPVAVGRQVRGALHQHELAASGGEARPGHPPDEPHRQVREQHEVNERNDDRLAQGRRDLTRKRGEERSCGARAAEASGGSWGVDSEAPRRRELRGRLGLSAIAPPGRRSG